MKTLAIRTLLLTLIVCGADSAYGQSQFGNEWINSGQKYFRIPIAQTGFYRLTDKELALAGIPTDSVPLENIRILRRGRDLPTEIERGLDSQERPITSISFYAQKNDGISDSTLYVNPSAQPHRLYSLYSDTASYFLTWHSDSIAMPMPAIQPIGVGELIDYHIEEVQELFTSFYAPGNFYPPGSTFADGITLSSYDVGEGWTGPEIKSGQKFTISLQTRHRTARFFPNAGINLTLVGRSAGTHLIEIIANEISANSRLLTTIDITNYNPGTVHIPLTASDVDFDGKIILTLKVEQGSCSVSAVQWEYPQKNTSQNAPQITSAFSASMNDKSWNYKHLSKTRLYHCPDVYNVSRILPSADSTLSLNNISKIIAVKEFFKVPALLPVNFNHDIPTDTEFLIISHPAVRKPFGDTVDPVAEYAMYRSSKEGGNYRTSVVNIQEINDRFNYGDRGPAGIKNLLRRMSLHGHLQFAFLIGRSVDPQTVRKSSDPDALDMIPNNGWPGSDIALAMKPGTAPEDFVPLVPIGRINAATPQQVLTYLEKVKTFESNPVSVRWRKNVLHLSGGRSVSELALFKDYVQSYEQKLKALGMSITTISKKTDDAVEQFPLAPYLNSGISLMTLFGHSGVNVTDLDIGYASDTLRNYANKPYFPAVFVNGCATGSIFYTQKTISEDWIFAPSAGSILFLAHTSNGISDALHRYTNAFYEVLADSGFTTQPFGVIQKEAIRRNMQRASLISDFSTAQQMTLHGDPAIRIFPAKYPDYTFDTTQIRFIDPAGLPLTSKSDSIKIKLGILNNGRSQNGNFQLSFKRTYNTGESEEKQFLLPSNGSADTVTLLIPRSKPSNNEQWKFVIDPENQIREENEGNNELVKRIEWPAFGATPLLPKDGFSTSENRIELVATVPENESSKTVVFEWDSTSRFQSPQKGRVDTQGLFARLAIENPYVNPGSIFWRVYLSDHNPSFSATREIQFAHGTPPHALPEVVAIRSPPGTSSIQEGDVFKLNADFVNASAVPFSDSIEVRIAHLNRFKSVTTLRKIPPLQGLEKRTVSLDLPSVGRVGPNDIRLTFNAGHLPEEIYTNNEVQHSYSVTPDVTRPLLSVRVDNRHLTDNENVSTRPLLQVGLIDENPFLIREDTSGIEVNIKRDCISCVEKRVSLSHAVISRQTPNTFFVEASPETPLNPGRYILRVKGRDVSGNMAVPYTIGFVVSDSAKILEAGVSPVPAHKWFRFYLNIEGQPSAVQWKVVVRDISGKIVHQVLTVLHPGKNELIWHPFQVPAGLLIYRMELTDQNYIPSQQTGNGLTGKMLWLP